MCDLKVIGLPMHMGKCPLVVYLAIKIRGGEHAMRMQAILDPTLPESVIGTNFLLANGGRRIAAEPREFSFEWKRQKHFTSKEDTDLSVVFEGHHMPFICVCIASRPLYRHTRIRLLAHLYRNRGLRQYGNIMPPSGAEGAFAVRLFRES